MRLPVSGCRTCPTGCPAPWACACPAEPARPAWSRSSRPLLAPARAHLPALSQCLPQRVLPRRGLQACHAPHLLVRALLHMMPAFLPTGSDTCRGPGAKSRLSAVCLTAFGVRLAVAWCCASHGCTRTRKWPRLSGRAPGQLGKRCSLLARQSRCVGPWVHEKHSS